MARIYPKVKERYHVLKEIWAVASIQRDPVGFPEGWEIIIERIHECLDEVSFKAIHPNQPTWGDGRTFLDRSRFQKWLEDGKIELISEPN